MNYKAVGFDYGGVIGGVGNSGPSFSDQVCILLGIDKPTYNEAFFGIYQMINLGGVATWREFLPSLLDRLGRPERLNDVIAINDNEERKLRIVSSVMMDIVDAIRQRGYKTGLLSNNTIEGGRAMRVAGLDDHFDTFHISAETKLMKPNPEAFQKFTHDLGVNIQELVFIDNSKNNLSTASKCGYTPILFNDPVNLSEQLDHLGITVARQ